MAPHLSPVQLLIPSHLLPGFYARTLGAPFGPSPSFSFGLWLSVLYPTFPHLPGPQPDTGFLSADGPWWVSPLHPRSQLPGVLSEISVPPHFTENPSVTSHCTQEIQRPSSPDTLTSCGPLPTSTWLPRGHVYFALDPCLCIRPSPSVGSELPLCPSTLHSCCPVCPRRASSTMSLFRCRPSVDKKCSPAFHLQEE